MSLPLFFGLSAALHILIGWRLVPWLEPGWAAGAFTLVLGLSAVLTPMGLVARRWLRPPAADRVAAVGLGFLGLFSSLLVLTLLREALLGLAWALHALSPALPARTAWQGPSALAVPPLALLVTVLGYLNARRIARVRTVEVPLDGLPPALHGFTIVQISDIHVGPTIRAGYVRGIVDAVNRLEPDLVAITGDLVDGPVHELGAHVAPLAGVVARHGSFFVTGNHEYYAGAQPWIAELRRLGIRVLHNEHVVIDREDARLVLAGVTDFSAGHFHADHRSDPHAAIAGAPADAAARVLLAHQPRSAPAAAQAGFDLQLSGHTHGGQFLPWNLFVRLQQPFTAGLHRLDGLWVYVSRGTGYWGPPKRFGAPSEITRVRLVRA